MVKLQRLTLSSLLIAMSILLSRLELSCFFSFGGSITLFSMVPMMIISLKYRYKWGCCCGCVFGILHLMTTSIKFQGLNLKAVFLSIFLDYILAYVSIGFLSWFYNKIIGFRFDLEISIIAVFFLRFIFHVISGVFIWSSFYSIKSFVSVIWLSISYNFSYLFPEMIINLIGMFLIKKFLVKFDIIKERV